MRKRTVIAKDSAKPDLAFFLCGLAATAFSMPFMLNFFCLSLRAILAGQLHVFVSACCPGGLFRRFAPAFHASVSRRVLSWKSPGPMGPRRAWTPSWASQAPPKRGLLRSRARTSQKGRFGVLRSSAFCEKYNVLYIFAFRTAASQKSGFFLKFGQILVQIFLNSGPGGPWKLLPPRPFGTRWGP